MAYRLDVAAWVGPWQQRLALHWGWLLPAAALALTALVYAPTLNDYFFADDFLDLVDIVAQGTARYIWDSLLLQGTSPYWRFLSRLLYLGEYRLFGLNAVPYHVINVALHLAVVLLVYYWAWQLTGRRAAGFLGALLFGIAPTYAGAGGLDGGAVAWVSAANRLLGTLFFLLSLILLQRYLRDRGAQPSAPSQPWRLAASAGAFLLVILSDEALVAFLPIPLLYAWLFHYWPRRDLGGFLLLVVPFAVVTLPPLAFIVYARTWQPNVGSDTYVVGWHMAENFWVYLGRLAFPVRAGGPWADSFWLSHRIGAVILGGVGLYFLARGPNQARFLVLWVPLALSPFLPFTLWSPARYTYPATIAYGLGLALLGLWAYERGRRLSPRWAALGGAAVLAAVLALAGALTVRWNSSFAFEQLRYRVLVEELREELPSVPPGSQIYILNGLWTDQFDNLVWLPAIGRTLYGPGVLLKNLYAEDCKLRTATAGTPRFALRYVDLELERAPLQALEPASLRALGCPAPGAGAGR